MKKLVFWIKIGLQLGLRVMGLVANESLVVCTKVNQGHVFMRRVMVQGIHCKKRKAVASHIA
ncbi:hypothetical protein BLD50_00175 [Bacillus cereus]|nr:hypothetical protein BLD50_00175 [Bacillus cereus]